MERLSSPRDRSPDSGTSVQASSPPYREAMDSSSPAIRYSRDILDTHSATRAFTSRRVASSSIMGRMVDVPVAPFLSTAPSASRRKAILDIMVWAGSPISGFDFLSGGCLAVSSLQFGSDPRRQSLSGLRNKGFDLIDDLEMPVFREQGPADLHAAGGDPDIIYRDLTAFPHQR